MCRNHSILKNFWRKHYVPKNLKIVGIGVDHERFVELVQKYFQFSSDVINQPLVTPPPSDNSIVKGGTFFVDNPNMNNALVVLGLHTNGFTSKST